MNVKKYKDASKCVLRNTIYTTTLFDIHDYSREVLGQQDASKIITYFVYHWSVITFNTVFPAIINTPSIAMQVPTYTWLDSGNMRINNLSKDIIAGLRFEPSTFGWSFKCIIPRHLHMLINIMFW